MPRPAPGPVRLLADERGLRASLHAMLGAVPPVSISAAELQALQREIASTGFPVATDSFTAAGVDGLAKDRLHYLLLHSHIDLGLLAGSYSYDASGGTALPASLEGEAAWRSFAPARGSAQYVCPDTGLTVALGDTVFRLPRN